MVLPSWRELERPTGLDFGDEVRGALAWVTLLFVLSAGAGGWLVWSYPELAGLFTVTGP